jgi:hypothetical protein
VLELEPPSQKEHPEDSEWHNGHGEAPDGSALKALELAHKAIAKFPELAKRYQKFIGPVAVVSTALIVLASIAVATRLYHGQSPEKILEEITPDEIENAGGARPAKPKPAKGRFLH